MHDPTTAPDAADRLPKGPKDRLKEAQEKLHGDRSERTAPGTRFTEAGPEDLDPPDDGPDPDLGPEPGFDGKTPFEAVEEVEGIGDLFTF